MSDKAKILVIDDEHSVSMTADGLLDIDPCIGEVRNQI